MATEIVPAPGAARAVRAIAGLALGLGVLLLLRAIAAGLPGVEVATGFLGPVFFFLALQPFVLLFLVVAAGYALGQVRFGSFRLGATASALIVGMSISVWAALRHVSFALPDFASTLMFNLFMFTVGLKVGPQFLPGLRRDGRAFISLGILIPLLSLALMLGANAVFHFGPGTAPGIFAGANTATAGIGSAKDVYAMRLGASSPALGALSTAFALSYCLSLVLFVLMTKVLPGWFGKDAAREAQAYQRSIEAGRSSPLPGTAQALEPGPSVPEVRAFRVENPRVEGRSIAELRRELPQVAVERVRKGTSTMDPTPDLRLQQGDVVVISGPLYVIARIGQRVGPEIADPGLRSVGLETVEVVAHAAADGRSLSDLMGTAGHGFELGAFFRGGTEIPFGPDTVVRKGDVLRLTGSGLRIHYLESAVSGRVIRPSIATDMITLALGLSLGALLGAIPIPVFGLKLSLGSAVGLLIAGIVLSTLRTRNPELGGPFPEPARLLLQDLGLNVFVAITALNAGAGVIAAVRSGGILPIVVVTLVVGLVPAVAGWAFGQYRHRMNAGLLVGAVTGARCSSAALRAAQEDTRSAVPALSYPVTFAISSVLITFACYLMATFG